MVIPENSLSDIPKKLYIQLYKIHTFYLRSVLKMSLIETKRKSLLPWILHTVFKFRYMVMMHTHTFNLKIHRYMRNMYADASHNNRSLLQGLAQLKKSNKEKDP